LGALEAVATLWGLPEQRCSHSLPLAHKGHLAPTQLPSLPHHADRSGVFRSVPFLFEAGDDFSASNTQMVSDLLAKPTKPGEPGKQSKPPVRPRETGGCTLLQHIFGLWVAAIAIGAQREAVVPMTQSEDLFLGAA